jgi:hypothetical protein
LNDVNPLRPTPAFLRKIACIVERCADRRVRAWADEVDRRFSTVSIVKTYRGGRLCGYEVWRHLAPSGEDPQRHKARLWFGLKHWRTEFGYDGAALDMARKAARRLRAMNRRELRDWWEERTRARARAMVNGRRRLPADHFLEVRLDYTDLERMSHVFATR